MAVRRMLRGVIFDMDGTLTVPCLDFFEMRRRCGVTQGDLLVEIEKMSPAKKQAAIDVITEMETEAKEKMEIMPGAKDLCDFLDQRNIWRGLVTRNVSSSVDHLHRKMGITPFWPALARDFLPFKPDPAPLLHICEAWKVQPSEVMIVGDSARDDIVMGRVAGSYAVLIDTEQKYGPIESLPELQRPHYKVTSLAEVGHILQTKFELVPKEGVAERESAL
ncbi:hypothetical protein KFL_006160060 [Klebsormidium nitens]|uniref:Haloacid dehalogenase-like hydrolase (HAD) superfamily protein n=1 Tax=Klebsormidium nitens TaxID=105231 RepID=A0A1Y1IJC6_KLENI|nr:hypothetical protein KFL_006160060 [Klebsormidium nitens]|eukprot:GAQ90232.1 hypothetical protein KFL_006160060 [Klebsormidium nitens]